MDYNELKFPTRQDMRNEIARLQKEVQWYERLLEDGAKGYRSVHSEKDWIVTKRSYVEQLEIDLKDE